MSDEVEVPYGENAGDTAVLLLAAAEELDLDPSVVRTSDGSKFVVPKEVADKAKVSDDPKKTAKKAAAKKDTGWKNTGDANAPDESEKPAKKTAAKKSAAKK